MPELGETARTTRAWACYDCGKCTATCPITRAGAAYSPRRHVLATNLGQRREIIDNGSLFSCLTCGLCDRRCPAQVGYTQLVQKLRELSHQEGVEPECPHGGALQSVMRMMATGGTQQDRMRWLSGDLKTEPKSGPVFYWTGCTMYYDAFFTDFQLATLEATRAAVRLMNKLGVTPVVSADERCCGHDLLWNGDRKNFELLARHNVKLVADSGAEVLIASCAECLRTWKLDYEPFFQGKPPQMIHISEFLAERMPELRFKPNGQRRVTFQDPCRLGRHLGIYDPPRQALAALPGIELVEMRRSGPAAMCCAGGTWSNCDRFAKQIQVERLREARATGAEMLVTACPKCQIHFRCAMKDPNLGGEIEIEMRDVAEVVAGALEQG
jgi:heterodisulfide reductase subunit D